MSIWAKLLAACVVLGLLVAATAFWMDLYGIRRGCLAPHLDPAGYQSAQALYEQASGAVSGRNYAAANDMLDMALSRLGDSYQLGRGADDTIEAVAAARSAAARSEFQVAAQIKAEVMGRRLSLLRRKMRLSDVCRRVAKRWHLA